MTDEIPAPRTDTTDPHPTYRVLTYGFRGVQVLLSGLAAIIAAGALSESAIMAAALGIYALVLLAFAVVIEFVAVQPCQERL